MNNKISVDINGSVSGIVNVGNNTININEKEQNSEHQLYNNKVKLDMNNNDNITEPKKDKITNNIIKIIIEIIIGVIISVIAGYILYKLNIN